MKKFLLGRLVCLPCSGWPLPLRLLIWLHVRIPRRHPRFMCPDLRLDRLLHRRQWRLGPEPQLCGFPWGGFDFADGCRERSGGLVGGQFGYRWQASQWVFGLEAQGDWADLSNTRVSLIDPAVLDPHQN